jgi:uncharacterized protein
MVDEQVLDDIVRRILAVAQPSRVILFGSCARGEADAGSDLDLMVIQPSVANRGEAMVRLRQAVGSVGTGVDVLVYSEAEVEARRDWCTSPVYWALREGRVLHAAG